MKPLINDWRTHQRKGVCTIQGYLTLPTYEKMFDTQDGEEQGSSIFSCEGKLMLLGPD